MRKKEIKKCLNTARNIADDWMNDVMTEGNEKEAILTGRVAFQEILRHLLKGLK